MGSWDAWASLIFRPDFRGRRHHGAAGGGLDDGAFGRAIHQTDCAAGIGAAFVDLEKMLRSRRDDLGVDLDLAADDVAHAAFGAFPMVDS